jgi:hypothetical protein
MHTTTKEVVTDDTKAKELGVEKGVHILTTTMEADGPFELASPKAKFDAEVIALRRTDSGGIFMQTALKVVEPTPAPVEAPKAEEPAPTPEELATKYLQEDKGLSAKEAAGAIERFGAANILRKKNEQRDSELTALLGGPVEPSTPKS